MTSRYFRANLKEEKSRNMLRYWQFEQPLITHMYTL